MPIAQIHLVRDAYPAAAIGAVLEEASRFYVATLYPGVEPPPLDRVRVFASAIEPHLWAAGGVLASHGGVAAPYFTCLVLAGRPVVQHHALIAGFSAIIAEGLGCDLATVRGQVIPVDPNNWGIGGVPASEVRRAEIAARG